MNDDERRIITQFVERVAGAAPAQAPNSPWGSTGGGSVPNTQARLPLPPVDRDADALITDLFTRHPEARYRITQTAFVQEAALVEAQNRIRQLEWEVQNAKSEAEQGQQSRGGLFGGMFGGGSRPQPRNASPPPQPVYPPGYNPGMLQQQRGGSGFLGTAVMTAAGVAGGMVLGNMLMNAFSGHGGAAQAASDLGGAGGGFGEEAVPASSSWTDPGAAAESQGWGSGGGQDASAAPDDASGGYDTSNVSYDDGGGGGYDDEET